MVADTIGGADGRSVNCLVRNGSIDLARNITDNYVEFPARPISGLSAVTIELWLLWGGGPDVQRIFDFGGGDGRDGTSFFSLQPRDTQGVLSATLNLTRAANDSAADWRVADVAALDKTGIHHVAVTFDRSRLALYVDGQLRASSNRAPQALSLIDDQNNWLGRSQFVSASELNAIVYELRIYDQALSAAEALASYQAGADP